MMIMVSTKRMLLVIPSLMVLLLLSSIEATNEVEHPQQHQQQHHPSSTIQCLEEERRALLDFKAGIIDPKNRLSSWSGEDCCSWAGVDCDNHTGHVVRLDLNGGFLGGVLRPSLISLTHLKHLDLSYNAFDHSPIPEFLSSFKQLLSLDLSWAGFYGVIPHHLGNLSTLQWLDLSNYLYRVDDARWLSGLVNLQLLDMSLVDFSKASNLLDSINALSSLQELRLFHCYGISSSLALSVSSTNLTNLRTLDLSYDDITSKKIPSWLFNLSNLEELRLSGNTFDEVAAAPIGNLASLEILELDVIDGFPEALANLCRLETLSSSYSFSINLVDAERSFSGCIQQSLKSLYLQLQSNDSDRTYRAMPPWLFGLTGLEFLYLSNSKIQGPLADAIGKLISLRALYLSSNYLEGGIPEAIGNLGNLRSLYLGRNNLNGTIPESLWRLLKLTDLGLGGNSLTGVLSEAHFARLHALKWLFLDGNSLVLNVSSDWIPPFQLEQLDLSSCILHPQFPTWIRTQGQLGLLNLSRTGIKGSLSDLLHNNWTSKLFLLDLSHNQLSGMLPSSLQFLSNLRFLNLSSNNLQGPIVGLPSSLLFLDLSDNSFTGFIPSVIIAKLYQLQFIALSSNNLDGAIPSSFCELQRLILLVISKNHLSGEIPDCWKSSFLLVFDVLSNNLWGEIPNSLASLSNLLALHLNNNNFSGRLPPSLSKAKHLISIDLSHNKFSGSIPNWFGESFSQLQFLNLRKNLFMGELPSQLARLVSLHVLDISLNNFSGAIPSSFGNFSSMISNKGVIGPYIFPWREIIYLVSKRREDAYGNLLPLQVSMDLSGNNLSGEIPEELTMLVALNNLNLSRNQLNGTITDKFGRLTRLESLDLSKNNLSGIIPPSLANLDSLGLLDLSYNNLSGRIPSSNHMDTFNSFNFKGNPYLCGNPLPNKCLGDELGSSSTTTTTHSDGHDEDEDSEEEDDGIFWLYIGIGSGFVVGFWIVWGVLILKKQWKIIYFRLADDISDEIYVKVVIYYRRLKHKISTGKYYLLLMNKK